jgi:hypothetical protein
MTTRQASCSYGQLNLTVEDDIPIKLPQILQRRTLPPRATAAAST